MMPITWHVTFLRDLLIHNALVIREGRKLAVPMRQLLVHDLSKLTLQEYLPSVRYEQAIRPPTLEERAA